MPGRAEWSGRRGRHRGHGRRRSRAARAFARQVVSPWPTSSRATRSTSSPTPRTDRACSSRQLGMAIDPDVLAAADGVSGRATFSFEQGVAARRRPPRAVHERRRPEHDGRLRPARRGSQRTAPPTVIDYASVVGLNTPTPLSIPYLSQRRAAAARRAPRQEVPDARRDRRHQHHRGRPDRRPSWPAGRGTARPAQRRLRGLDAVRRPRPRRPPGATARSGRGVDRHGVDLVDRRRRRARTPAIDFAEPVSDPMALTGALRARARAAPGRARPGRPAPSAHGRAGRIRTFLTTVVAVATSTRTCGGSPSGAATWRRSRPSAPTRSSTCCCPRRGDADHRPVVHVGAARPDAAGATSRSVRTTRCGPGGPRSPSSTCCSCIHGDGPASGVGRAGGPGDPVALWGPRTAYHPPDAPTWLLLAADETGLPAVAVILEQLPDGMPARVVAEVADGTSTRTCPSAGRRRGHVAATATAPRPARRRCWPTPCRARPGPPGTPYVWGGGESRTMTAVRRHVRDDRGLDRDACLARGLLAPRLLARRLTFLTRLRPAERDEVDGEPVRARRGGGEGVPRRGRWRGGR